MENKTEKNMDSCPKKTIDFGTFAERSENISKLLESLSKAQGEFKTPPKNKEVKYKQTAYKFANLATIIETNKAHMAKNDLCITQINTYRGDKYGLLTILSHKSGEYITSWHPLPDPSKMAPQEFGSRLTYSRRYSYQTIQGVEGDADEDGKLATESHSDKNTSNAKPNVHDGRPKQGRPLKQDEFNTLWNIAQNEGGLSKDEFIKVSMALYKVPPQKILRNQADEFVKLMREKKRDLVSELADDDKQG